MRPITVKTYDKGGRPLNGAVDPFDYDSSVVFFDDQNESHYKIYNDGGHFVGTLIRTKYRKYTEFHDFNFFKLCVGRYYAEAKKLSLENYELFDYIYNRILKSFLLPNLIVKTRCIKYIKGYIKSKSCISFSNLLDIYFDELYVEAEKQGLKREKKIEYIENEIRDVYDNIDNLHEYVEKRVDSEWHKFHSRLKRLRRKTNLNKWNYFTTFTYDDKKQTEESFRLKLRRCLSNIRTRHKWRFMGVFERAPETGRLHFHVLMYIPNDEMVGDVEERQEYNVETKRMETVYVNDFFEKRFGRNDFRPISGNKQEDITMMNYLIKYITKTKEKIVYSRGIPTEICMKMSTKDIASYFVDFVRKFVFFDDVIDWERDILNAPRFEPPPKPIEYEQVLMAV